MLPFLKGWIRWQMTGITVVNLNHVVFDQYIGRPNAKLRRKYPTMQLDTPWGNPFRITGRKARATRFDYAMRFRVDTLRKHCLKQQHGCAYNPIR